MRRVRGFRREAPTRREGDGMHDMEFARNLRRAMAERGVSAKALAMDTGISRSTIDYLLSGRRSPTHSTARRIRDALGCTWDELLGD